MAQPEPQKSANCMNNQNKVGRPKSEEKRVNILIAASNLFLAQGFSSTSMDQVAKQAEVSKQTVYSHFSNKDALFTAVITYKCSQYQLGEEHMRDFEQDPFDALQTYGNQIINLLQDEQSVAMHRVVIGEITTNPHVAEMFYEAGPLHGINILRDYFQRNIHLRLDKTKAEYWSYTLFNMLKGDFYLRSLLGLPFSKSETKQSELVTRVVSQVLQLIEAER
ncbi:TetR/AcrR family transcriptional regulator [Aliiglaciecola lipolytica]|uniref:Transcriptional regulator, TetR family protein n=1 Tax=Aliiglaciecola lipolytica E3 TaxID=1127673 RepID=K6YCW3_9ALTE|nr:TetR/AcrR family transcriptional regulator [Aliiglaciecola lipolytica]GAC16037.1 transcriptional regulator, TetR family protein [Aliiglaciecola lipolytica E3]